MGGTWEIIEGGAVEVMRGMPGQSVNCVVTSPPYWGLRDYGVEGQIGAEATHHEYVGALVSVFAEAWRVLRDDGTLWLVMGDAFAGSWGAQSRSNGTDKRSGLQGGSLLSARQLQAMPKTKKQTSLKHTPGLKRKDLIGLPWLVAFALQEFGWYLRAPVIWDKPNGMCESVKDRPTLTHEYVFLLSKKAKYYYDHEAIAESLESDPKSWGRHLNKDPGAQAVNPRPLFGPERCGRDGTDWGNGTTRNKRSVWRVATRPFPGAHFATFPPELIRPCILAGCPEGGVVLDPFSGAGTTVMESVNQGRRGIGIELNPEYCEIARVRIERETGLMGCFIGPRICAGEHG